MRMSVDRARSKEEFGMFGECAIKCTHLGGGFQAGVGGRDGSRMFEGGSCDVGARRDVGEARRGRDQNESGER
jgi:hypothetical protein